MRRARSSKSNCDARRKRRKVTVPTIGTAQPGAQESLLERRAKGDVLTATKGRIHKFGRSSVANDFEDGAKGNDTE